MNGCVTRRTIVLLALLVVSTATLLVAAPSQATFRGQNGRIAFEAQVGANRQLFTVNPDGTGLTQVTHFSDSGGTNGKRIVFSKPEFSQNGQSSNVFTVKADGTGEVQLTHETGGALNAGADSWSPDGAKIAYVSNKTGTYQIWTMNADGSGQTQLTKGPEAHLAAWGSHP